MLNNKYIRTALFIVVDCMLLVISYLLGLVLMFNEINKYGQLNEFKNIAIFIIPIYLLMYLVFRLYRSLWKQASIHEYLSLAAANVISCGVILLLCKFILKTNFSNTVHVLACFFMLTLSTLYRLSFRYMNSMQNIFNSSNEPATKVLIIGAGYSGKTVISKLREDSSKKYNIVGIIDDDPQKKGFSISGVKIVGNSSDILKISQDKKANLIVIAISKLDNKKRRELINLCAKTGCEVKIVPDFDDVVNNNNKINIRNIEPEDLLGRDVITLDNKQISEYIEGKVVLVTGGGGSIGSELCRQITNFNPSKLIILDIYENNAYDLQNELKYKYPYLNHEVIIASVRDKKRIDMIFEKHKPDIVFHAAAHKHVPLMEDNPCESIKNNVFGTLNVIIACDKASVKKMVLISTDKAVNPTNIMGASKRICEMLVQTFAGHVKTELVAVRFGNVLGSNGSVIPLFKKQISHGGPVTVTHKEITRYFMTIPEAAQLVIQAGAYAKGGEIFVLDMGKPVKMYDLAVDLIRLSGYEPNVDIPIKITGLRPGEKLYEELLMSDKTLINTKHDKIFVEQLKSYDIEQMKNNLNKLKNIIDDNKEDEIRDLIMKIVPTYKPQN